MQAKSEFFLPRSDFVGTRKKILLQATKKNPRVASKDLKFCRFKPENKKNKKKLLQARSKIGDTTK